MKAIVGRTNVREWLGGNLAQAMLSMVNREHVLGQEARKCHSQFEGFTCCRSKGHEGFHFSRTWSKNDGHFLISAAWEA